MILEQHYLACLAQASYLIGDEVSATAAVVDPRRDVDLYLERAAELSLTVRHVILTHFHADFLAGHLELAQRTGATIYLGAGARADYAFQPLADGEELELGPKVRLRALATPGHTPESVSLLVFDSDQSSDEPQAVLTGDTLFIGDVGRPDLMASEGLTAEDLAGMMYDSLRTKLMTLPDATLVYPGHGAGSACGKNLSKETLSTIGDQRRLNYALQPMERKEFIAQLTTDLPPAPAYFPRAAALNKSQHPTLDTLLSQGVPRLSLDQLLAQVSRGAQVLDTRGKDAFAAGHLAGSICIGLDGQFASWAGKLLDLDAPVVLVAEPGRETESATRLARIGLDRVVGCLAGGAAGLEGAPRELLGHVARIDVAGAARELEGPDAPLVLDVREPTEYEAGHVERALSLPLPELEAGLERVPKDRRLLVHCKSGYRSMTAVSLLQRRGYSRAVDVAGGFDAWLAAGRPVSGTGATCS